MRRNLRLYLWPSIKQNNSQSTGINIDSSKDGKLLGLKLQRTGLTGHVTVIQKGKGILSKLKRFNNLTPKLKTTLVQTLLLPVIEYPPIPLCSISKSQKISMQKVVKKAIRFINSNDTERGTIEDLHHKYKLTPYNIFLHNKACKIRENIRMNEEQTYNSLVRPIARIHHGFPRTCDIIQTPQPTPMYTSHSYNITICTATSHLLLRQSPTQLVYTHNTTLHYNTLYAFHTGNVLLGSSLPILCPESAVTWCDSVPLRALHVHHEGSPSRGSYTW